MLPTSDIETGNDVNMMSSRPKVTGKRPEVVGDTRETTEMTSYRSKMFAYQPEVVGDNTGNDVISL